MVDGHIVIPKIPEVSKGQLFPFGKLALIGALASIPKELRFTRRTALKAALVAGGSLFLPNLVEAEQYQIVPVEYERSLGVDRSFPWLGARKGIKAAGLEEGGPWDKYDELDQKINGYRARSVYWPKMGGPASTREWLTNVLYQAIQDQVSKDVKQGDNPDTAEVIARGWIGYCLDGAAASYFAPHIEGSISVLGIEFTDWDRSVIATMRWGGLAREQLDPLNNPEEVARRIKNGEAVGVNRSDIPTQDWWGLARDIKDDGIVVITNTSDLGESGLQTLEKPVSQLRQAVVLHEDSSQPGYEGNFAVVDRQVGGLIVGTHQLVA